MPSLDNIQILSRFVKESILAITSWPKLDDTDNFFSLGMDSFQALMTVRKLKEGLVMPIIAVSTVYTNPSVSALASSILRLSQELQNLQELDQQARDQMKSKSIKEY